MLEQMRRQGASIFIYLIFGLLIVIFIWGINPGNSGGQAGCGTSSNSVIRVDGEDANQTAYYVAYFSRAQRIPNTTGRQKVYLSLELLLRRELLAQAAAAQGLRVTGELVDEAIKRGEFFVGGETEDAHPIYFDE